jgi:potassium/hydrogen antiporter
MSSNAILIILSLAIIFSYVFDVIGKRLKLPSVVLLLISGITIRSIFPDNIEWINYEAHILPALGTLGLILIVLEGTLELELSREKLPLIRQTFLAAFYQLMFNVGLISLFFMAMTNWSLLQAMINATPFAVVSSAIAIPSSEHLQPHQREFVIYESTFSDILGIMLFNLLLNWANIGWWASVHFVHNTIFIVLISVLACLFLAFLLEKIHYKVKFLPIVSILLLAYAIAKMLHLSALLLVMMLGMLLNNMQLVLRYGLQKWFHQGGISKNLPQFKILVSEVTFVVRTFFFLLFGYSIVHTDLLQYEAFEYAGGIIAAIFVIRFLYLWVATKHISPVMSLFAPRGLITVLLFISIPEWIQLTAINKVVLMLVVLFSSILLATGILTSKKS